jgi:hypothetical protein
MRVGVRSAILGGMTIATARSASTMSRSSVANVLSTHLLRRSAMRRAAGLRRLQRRATGSYHSMPDWLSEKDLADAGIRGDDVIHVVPRGRGLRRHAVVARRP